MCASPAIRYTHQTDAVTSSRAVDFEFARVGSEALGRILCGDAALNSESTDGDTVLGKTEFLQ